MKFRLLALSVLAGLLVSCVDTPIISTVPFQISERAYLYDKAVWSFSGKLGFSDEKNSFSGSISWKHHDDYDQLDLAGSLGQGRTLIEITGDSVVIDYGDEKLQYFGNVDAQVSRHLGMTIPVSALKYWVLGIVDPVTEYIIVGNGFLQSGWMVNYQMMQVVEEGEMPRRIRIERNDVKLKLFIKQWDL